MKVGCSDKHDVGMTTMLEIMFQEKRLLVFPVLIAVMGQKYIKSKVTFNRSTLSEMIWKICIVGKKMLWKALTMVMVALKLFNYF